MDAFVQCAFLCPTLDDSVECLEAGIKKGARDQTISQHWRVLTTLPQDGPL
jgi:hypothetical protein